MARHRSHRAHTMNTLLDLLVLVITEVRMDITQLDMLNADPSPSQRAATERDTRASDVALAIRVQ